jgi:hypothetical protein
MIKTFDEFIRLKEAELNEDPTKWHLKPAGVKGPCPICGCPARALKSKHRAVIDENGNQTWEKIFKVGFGQDTSIERYNTRGWPA